MTLLKSLFTSGPNLPESPAPRVVLTPQLEQMLEDRGYQSIEDPFFSEVVELVRSGNLEDAVVRWRELTGHSIEEARLWFTANGLFSG